MLLLIYSASIMNKKIRFWKYLYNSDKTGERLVSLTAVFLLQEVKLKLYTSRKTYAKKSSNICSKLIFALYKKLPFKIFLCLVFEEGILYSVEFIHWFLFFPSKCLMISPDSWLACYIFTNPCLIQMHVFPGFSAKTYHLNALPKIKLLIGQLIPKVLTLAIYLSL